MKRAFGIVLFGIGIALALLAASLKYYVAPTALNIPYDLEPSTTIAEAHNGKLINTDTSDPAVVQALLTGTPDYAKDVQLRSYTWVTPQPGLTRDKLTGDLADTAVVWDVYDQMEIIGGDVLSAGKETIALDRKSGAVIAWDQATNPKEQGQAYKLPFEAEQTTYPYWDGVLGKTLDMTYAATETVSGFEAYRYEQKTVEAKVDAAQLGLLTAEQVDLLKTFIGAGSGDVYYSVQRTISVEPTTGQYLNVKQSVKFEFRGGNGEKRTLLSGDFEYTDESKTKAADGIKTNRDLIILVSKTLPLYGGGAGALLFLIGLVLIATGGRKKKAAEPTPTEPAPAAPATPAAPAS